MKKLTLSFLMIVFVSLMLFSAKILPDQSISFHTLSSVLSDPDALDDSLDDVNGRFISVAGPVPLPDNINWKYKRIAVFSNDPSGFVLRHVEDSEETIPCDLALVLKSNFTVFDIIEANKKVFYIRPGSSIKPGWAKSDFGVLEYPWNEYNVVLFFRKTIRLEDYLTGTYKMDITVDGLVMTVEVINPGGHEEEFLVIPRWGTPASDIDLQSASGAFMVNLEVITSYSHKKSKYHVPRTTIYPADCRSNEASEFFFIHKDDEKKVNYAGLDTYYPYTVDVINTISGQRKTISGRLHDITVTHVQDNFWYASYDLCVNHIKKNTESAKAGDYVSYIIVEVQSRR